MIMAGTSTRVVRGEGNIACIGYGCLSFTEMSIVLNRHRVQRCLSMRCERSSFSVDTEVHGLANVEGTGRASLGKIDHIIQDWDPGEHLCQSIGD